jgi:hypothetical protein
MPCKEEKNSHPMIVNSRKLKDLTLLDAINIAQGNISALYIPKFIDGKYMKIIRKRFILTAQICERVCGTYHK